MLIVTADDYGRNRRETDAALAWGTLGRITCASAMVFMRDSERAAALSRHSALEFGLHLNFTEPLAESGVPSTVRLHHERVRRFLGQYRLAPLLFNPTLQRSFRIVFEAQRGEYERLYKAPPAFYNGHHHMHLCTNLLAGRLIPPGSRIRNTFTFEPGEKGPINRAYRGVLRRWIAARYLSTDSFHALAPLHSADRIRALVDRARSEVVELEVHPGDAREAVLLGGTAFGESVASARLGTFADVVPRPRSARSCSSWL
jgi:chitin disaccharide deacetylase